MVSHHCFVCRQVLKWIEIVLKLGEKNIQEHTVLINLLLWSSCIRVRDMEEPKKSPGIDYGPLGFQRRVFC